MFRALFAFLFAMLASLASTFAHAQAASEYRLGPGDVVRITV